MVVTHLLQVLAFTAMEPPTALEPDGDRRGEEQGLPLAAADRAAPRGARPVRGLPRRAGRRPRLPDRDLRRAALRPSTTGAGRACPSSCAPASAWPRARASSRSPSRSRRAACSRSARAWASFGPDHLTFDLADATRMSLSFYGKRPGPGHAPRSSRACSSRSPRTTDHVDVLEAYERLIYDAMVGDHTLFAERQGHRAALGGLGSRCSTTRPRSTRTPRAPGARRADERADRPAHLAPALRAELARDRLRPPPPRQAPPSSTGDSRAVGVHAEHGHLGAADHEVDVDLAGVDPLGLGRVGPLGVAGAERDVARGVLVEQGVVEDRARAGRCARCRPPAPPRPGAPRPRRRAARARSTSAPVVGVDLHRAAALEAHLAGPLHHRAAHVERPGGGDERPRCASGSGVVNTSSVGMFGRCGRPSRRWSPPPTQCEPGSSPTVRSVPGPTKRSAESRRASSRARRGLQLRRRGRARPRPGRARRAGRCGRSRSHSRSRRARRARGRGRRAPAQAGLGQGTTVQLTWPPMITSIALAHRGQAVAAGAGGVHVVEEARARSGRPGRSSAPPSARSRRCAAPYQGGTQSSVSSGGVRAAARASRTGRTSRRPRSARPAR